MLPRDASWRNGTQPTCQGAAVRCSATSALAILARPERIEKVTPRHDGDAVDCSRTIHHRHADVALKALFLSEGFEPFQVIVGDGAGRFDFDGRVITKKKIHLKP